MTLVATILGCGSSGGVPRIGYGWGACDPNNPKNRRRRCSLLVERIEDFGRTSILVDTGPDLREQLLAANVDYLDAVLYTHEHADHIHGIDDLRVLAIHMQTLLRAYASARTSRELIHRFGYCFETPAGSDYPPIATLEELVLNRPKTIAGRGGGVEFIPFDQRHGDVNALGFRFGGLAYSSDLNGLPEESLPILENLDIWIVDALRYKKHPSHWNVEETLRWIDRFRPKRAILTNLHTDLDFDTLSRDLPPGVEPAFDGMRLVLEP